MKIINGVLMCLAVIAMLTACDGKGSKVQTSPSDSTTVADVKVVKGDNSALNIYKIWVNEDNTQIFDLRDSTHYIEATKFDEEYCKEYPDYKPDVFYITTEAAGFIVSHNFESEGDTIGGVEYLIEQGPYAGTHALRFTFSNMTPTSATFTFEGEYDWKYKVLDEPVEMLPDPHPYVYEE